MKYFIIPFILIFSLLTGLVHATSFWVSGAWVNVRDSATTASLVVAQLPTNTEVTLIKTEDKFSLVEFKQNNSTKQGFIANSFLANKPLTLADIRRDEEGDKVRKAFWISPSLQNLFNVGEYYNRLYSDNNATYSDKPTSTYKAKVIPEYEAMKGMFKSGIIITNQELGYQNFSDYINDLKKQFMTRKEDYDSQYKSIIDTLEQYRKKYKPQPSFFKSEKEVISANATFDTFSSYLQPPPLHIKYFSAKMGLLALG